MQEIALFFLKTKGLYFFLKVKAMKDKDNKALNAEKDIHKFEVMVKILTPVVSSALASIAKVIIDHWS